jgi:hypothetical protein
MRPALLPRGVLTELDPQQPGGTVRVVYQRTARGLGNVPNVPGRVLQRRAYVIPADPRTPIQRALRARLAAATAAWKTLPELDRTAWRALALSRGPTGFMLYVRDYCAAHPINPDSPLLHPACLLAGPGLAPAPSPALPGLTAPPAWTLDPAALAAP